MVLTIELTCWTSSVESAEGTNSLLINNPVGMVIFLLVPGMVAVEERERVWRDMKSEVLLRSLNDIDDLNRSRGPCQFNWASTGIVLLHFEILQTPVFITFYATVDANFVPRA
jgi:hypothetical protein